MKNNIKSSKQKSSIDNVIQLHKFNPKKMEARRVDPEQGPPSILLIGSKRTGKTYLIRDLMYYFRKIRTGLIVTGSEGSAEVFSEFFPRICIFDELDEALLERITAIVRRQRKLRKMGVDKELTSCFFLFDDVGYDKKGAKSEIIRGMFMNGRHWNTLTIMSVQYSRSIGPDLRKNVDYVFIMREPRKNERKKLYEDFGGVVGDEKDFNKIMNLYTEDYGCLVIDNTTQKNDIRENVFCYRAKYPPRKNFRVGDEKLWTMHAQLYKSDDESDEENKVKLSTGQIIMKKPTTTTRRKNKRKTK